MRTTQLITGTVAQAYIRPETAAGPIEHRQYEHNAECDKCGTRISWNGDEGKVNICPSVGCLQSAVEAEAITILKRIEEAIPGWDGTVGEVGGDPDDHPIMHALRRIEQALGIPAKLKLQADRAEALRLARAEVGEPDPSWDEADYGAYVELITEATVKHLRALQGAA